MKDNAAKMAENMMGNAAKMAEGMSTGKSLMQQAAERKLGKTGPSKAAKADSGEHARIVIDILMPGEELEEDEDYGDEELEQNKDDKEPKAY